MAFLVQTDNTDDSTVSPNPSPKILQQDCPVSNGWAVGLNASNIQLFTKNYTSDTHPTDYLEKLTAHQHRKNNLH